MLAISGKSYFAVAASTPHHCISRAGLWLVEHSWATLMVFWGNALLTSSCAFLQSLSSVNATDSSRFDCAVKRSRDVQYMLYKLLERGMKVERDTRRYVYFMCCTVHSAKGGSILQCHSFLNYVLYQSWQWMQSKVDSMHAINSYACISLCVACRQCQTCIMHCTVVVTY